MFDELRQGAASIFPGGGLPGCRTSSDSCRVHRPSGYAHHLSETSSEHRSRFADLVEYGSSPRRPPYEGYENRQVLGLLPPGCVIIQGANARDVVVRVLLLTESNVRDRLRVVLGSDHVSFCPIKECCRASSEDWCRAYSPGVIVLESAWDVFGPVR